MGSKKNRNKGGGEGPRRPVGDATPAQWLQNATEVLESVRHAAEDFERATSLSRAKTAVRNFVEQARSVTWALQHLKGGLPEEWDAWWFETTEQLRSNPAAQWFYALRNPIVKEGRPVNIKGVSHMKGTYTFPPPDETRPEGATNWQLDGQLRPWWVMADGSRVPGVPLEGVRRWNTIESVPDELRDQPLTDLMRQYIGILEGIVEAATAKFLPPTG